jgi:isopentenyl diphosphate isomerase/L-lactate dehydrogenase-like FMN-dependent dehydrogenase
MTLPSPVFMAPIGVIGLCAQDGHGDLATARAAARTGVPMVASTLTVDPMEEVAAEFGDTPGFFQLYTPTDRDLAASLVHRAEAAGFKGIVVTLDTWVTGWRPRDLAPQLPPAARPLPGQLHQRPGLPRPLPDARGGPAGRRRCTGPASSATRSPGTTCPGCAR